MSRYFEGTGMVTITRTLKGSMLNYDSIELKCKIPSYGEEMMSW